tara:strand:- start:449 stop:715 length:267 start_codon:yes stop_codon:yes gene_type:complete
MKAVTVREEGTDSPNIGTISMPTESVSQFNEKLRQNLTEHYDADCEYFSGEINYEQLFRKGTTELEIRVDDSGAIYTTTITLELTAIY